MKRFWRCFYACSRLALHVALKAFSLCRSHEVNFIATLKNPAPQSEKNGGQDKRRGTVVPRKLRLHRRNRGTASFGTSAVNYHKAARLGDLSSAICAVLRSTAQSDQHESR